MALLTGNVSWQVLCKNVSKGSQESGLKQENGTLPKLSSTLIQRGFNIDTRTK